MHYTESYAGLSDAEKRKKALQDIRDFLGEGQFDRMSSELKTLDKPTFESFETTMAMVSGVEGYPVRAFYEHIWPANLEEGA